MLHCAVLPVLKWVLSKRSSVSVHILLTKNENSILIGNLSNHG